jgi:hypothetical protein
MKDNQNAFPVTYGNDGVEHGMTLRDYFAAKAMQGLLRDSNANDGLWHIQVLFAYKVADAMMEARKK